MLTTTTTAAAVPHIKQGRARALSAVGGALAAALAWVVEVPLLGIHLNVRFGAGHTQTIAIGQVIGVTLAASLALPLAAATTTSAVTGLIVMHVTVGAIVIPAMAHTARAR